LTYDTEKLLVWELAYKATLENQYFIDSEPKGEVISFKIIDWWPFILKNSNGHGGLNFLSHTLQILEINLSFEADIRKMETRSLSIYRDLHALQYSKI
jgi:hypothetical protein